MATDTRSLKDIQGRIEHLRRKVFRAFDEAGPGFDLAKVRSIPGSPAAKMEAIREADRELGDLTGLVEARLDLVGTRVPSTSARRPGESIGARFVDSAAYKRRGGSASAELDVDPVAQLGLGRKAVLGSDDALVGVDTEWPLEATRTPIISNLAAQPPSLAEVVPVLTVDGWQTAYMEETTATNAAAPVEEGQLYPEPTLDLVERAPRLRKIGVLLPVTDDLLDDEPAVRGYVDRRLSLFTRQRVDEQLVDGDGTGQNLEGFHTVAGTNSATYTNVAPTTQDKIAAILEGAGKVATVGQAVADTVVIEAAEWWGFLGARDSQDQFLFDPGQPPSSLFGLRPTITTHQVAGRYLVGAVTAHSILFVRRGIDVKVSTEHKDFFGREKTAIKARLPAWLAVLRPAAFTEVTEAAGS